jgi:hypothetical protein
MNQEDFTVDEEQSRDVLQRLRTEVFNGSDEDLAVAMGRPIGEVQEWLGGGEIDEDAQMKINGIAKERLSGE